MEYSEHVRRNRDHEREVFARLNESARKDRWDRRQRFLWGWFSELSEKGRNPAKLIVGCPACVSLTLTGSTGVDIKTDRWPSYFKCACCGILICLDKRSHLLPDEIERRTFITRQALRDLKQLGLLKQEYPFEDRITDLRGGNGITDLDNIFLRACGIKPLEVVRGQEKKAQTKTPGRLRLEEFWAEDR